MMRFPPWAPLAVWVMVLCLSHACIHAARSLSAPQQTRTASR